MMGRGGRGTGGGFRGNRGGQQTNGAAAAKRKAPGEDPNAVPSDYGVSAMTVSALSPRQHQQHHVGSSMGYSQNDHTQHHNLSHLEWTANNAAAMMPGGMDGLTAQMAALHTQQSSSQQHFPTVSDFTYS